MSRKFPLCFGGDDRYELNESALKHILVGDTAVRPVNALNIRTVETALSGGLHTWSGWENFLTQHPSVVHLFEYDNNRHADWFYARELQNGVITLKIPRRMFTGDAASITMQPDIHYKSGYLWKTLYPLGFTEDDIIDVLTEAFDNLDREESTHPTPERPAGVLFGYALLDSPLKAMKLRIQVRGNQIQSAFPAWEQPASGNNGKPYSHSHSINFAVATSTVHHERYNKPWGPVFSADGLDMSELLKLTPSFILRRTRRDPAIGVDTWRDTRERELIALTPSMTSNDLQRIETYLNDYVCSKDPYGMQANLYVHLPMEIERWDYIYNAAQILENVAECIQVLTHSDRQQGTRRAMDGMLRFLRMAIVHTGGLSSLMFKRVIGECIEAAVGHHDKNAIRDLFAALASSPCRAALYTEFNLNPFVMKNDPVGWLTLGVPQVEINLTPEHLMEFISLQLGENYMMVCSKEQRLAIAASFFPLPEQKVMMVNAMSFLSGIDFQFFMPHRLMPAWLEAKSAPAEDDLIAIARDYSRMLVIYRQRIVMEDYAAYKAIPDFEQAGTEEFFNLIRQKNKRQFVLTLHETMLHQLIQYADIVGYKKLAEKLTSMLERLPKEAVPMPKPIPDYIRKGRDWPTSFTGDTEAMVRVIMGIEPATT